MARLDMARPDSAGRGLARQGAAQTIDSLMLLLYNGSWRYRIGE